MRALELRQEYEDLKGEKLGLTDMLEECQHEMRYNNEPGVNENLSKLYYTLRTELSDVNLAIRLLRKELADMRIKALTERNLEEFMSLLW